MTWKMPCSCSAEEQQFQAGGIARKRQEAMDRVREREREERQRAREVARQKELAERCRLSAPGRLPLMGVDDCLSWSLARPFGGPFGTCCASAERRMRGGCSGMLGCAGLGDTHVAAGKRRSTRRRSSARWRTSSGWRSWQPSACSTGGWREDTTAFWRPPGSLLASLQMARLPLPLSCQKIDLSCRTRSRVCVTMVVQDTPVQVHTHKRQAAAALAAGGAHCRHRGPPGPGAGRPGRLEGQPQRLCMLHRGRSDGMHVVPSTQVPEQAPCWPRKAPESSGWKHVHHDAQAEELQRLEAERKAILQRRAPQLLEQPAAGGADAHGAAGDLLYRILGCCTVIPARGLQCVCALSSLSTTTA
jgi:hypothetical protein